MKTLTKFEQRVLWIALLIHLVAAWFSIGHHHPDEHYQLIEFANYKLGQTPVQDLAWEFSAAMRPGLQPFLAYIALAAYRAAGWVNPYHFTFLLRLLSGLLALLTAWRFHQAIRQQINNPHLQRLHLLLSLFGWGLVYLHVRFSSENWSAMCFTLAAISLLRKGRYDYLWFGIWAGLSFVFRFQAGFFLAGAGLWMLVVQRAGFRRIGLVITGFLASFLLGVACDFWLYGRLTLSSWAYLDQNIFQHKAAAFGVEPWYWYFDQIFNLTIPPFSLVLLAGLPLMWWRRPKEMLTWSCTAFLLAHCAVGHKEFRFLFPMAFFVPYIAVTVLEAIQDSIARLKGKIAQKLRWSAGFVEKCFWITNTVALLLLALKPASDQIALNKYLYDHIQHPTILIYSTPLSPYVADQQDAEFYRISNLKTYCIDEIMNDTAQLKGRQVLLFSEHAFKKDEFMFQFAPAYFDSSRTTVLYSSLPRWLYRFNYNNWLERSNAYSIYTLNTGAQ